MKPEGSDRKKSNNYSTSASSSSGSLMKINTEKQIVVNKNALTIGKAFTQHGRINKTNSIRFIRSIQTLHKCLLVVFTQMGEKIRLMCTQSASTENCFLFSGSFFAFIHSNSDQINQSSFFSFCFRHFIDSGQITNLLKTRKTNRCV